jgi:glycosyltransferase involved in cell wall biosynthesis
MRFGKAMEKLEKVNLSIVIPAKNEARRLKDLLPDLRRRFRDAEILVVNDGSEDGTSELSGFEGVKLLHNPYSMGNGAAIKRGAREASGDILVFMDADGQHQPADVEKLLRRFLEGGYDMLVGERGRTSQASAGRSVANRIFNWLASWMSGQKVKDLTSGFRVVHAEKFKKFLHLLPNGFSYPTTITMAFFRSGYSVGYEPVEVLKREGKSHIRPIRDGVRFLLIIFRIGTLYSPLKLFLPISFLLFLSGMGLYTYTFVTAGRFTNMSALLFSTSLLIFLIGMVSEQITHLLYSRQE